MDLTIAITGASGPIYGKRLLETCRGEKISTRLIISPAAEEIMKFELDETDEQLRKVATTNHGYKELDAPISSGSSSSDAMVIVPCSMKTLGSIANGVTDNLITRVADVILKEGKTLILVPRETPFNLIHLKNMERLIQAGAVILPANPAFYHDPKSIKDLVDFVVGKILDQLDIEHELYTSWAERRENDES